MNPSGKKNMPRSDGIRPRAAGDIVLEGDHSPQPRFKGEDKNTEAKDFLVDNFLNSYAKNLRTVTESVKAGPERPAKPWSEKNQDNEVYDPEGIIITEPVKPSSDPDQDVSGGVVYESPVTEVEGPQLKKTARGWRSLWWGVVSGLVAALVLIMVTSTIFARLTIRLEPRIEKLILPETVLALDISVSKILVEQRVLPAERLEFFQTMREEFNSTGKEFIQEPARGRMRIYNRFSSSGQTLVQGTRFLTDSGILFRLTKNIVLPGAKIEEGKIVAEYAEAELVADRPGEEANIAGEVSLKIPGFKGSSKYEGFGGVAPAGFSGGFKGEARVVSREDLKNAEEQVTKKVYEALSREIIKKVPPDFKFLDALRQIQISKLDIPREKERRDRFIIEATAQAKVLIFRESDTIVLLKDVLLKEDSNKDLLGEFAVLSYRVRDVDFEKGRATAILQGEIKARSNISTGGIANLVKNKKEGSIVEILKGRSEIAAFNLSFFPPWLFKAPADPAKIFFVNY